MHSDMLVLNGIDHKDDLEPPRPCGRLFLGAGRTLEKVQEPAQQNRNERELRGRLLMCPFL